MLSEQVNGQNSITYFSLAISIWLLVIEGYSVNGYSKLCLSVHVYLYLQASDRCNNTLKFSRKYCVPHLQLCAEGMPTNELN